MQDRDIQNVEAGLRGITSGMRQHVVETIVYPSCVKDIKDALAWRFKWRKIGNVCYAIAKILAIVGACFAFAETYFENRWLAFVSGCVAITGVLMVQFGDFAHKESKKRTAIANKLLDQLKIDVDVAQVLPNTAAALPTTMSSLSTATISPVQQPTSSIV